MPISVPRRALLGSLPVFASLLTAENALAAGPRPATTTVTHRPAHGDQGALVGPDRGYRTELAFNAIDLSSPWDAELAHDVTAHIDDAVATWGDGFTTAQLYIYLYEFAKQPLTTAAADNIRTIFTEMRKRGLHVVLRFAFDDAKRPNQPYTVQDVQRSISEVAPIVAEFADTVAVWQSGFVGAWGEWGPNHHNLQNYPEAVDAIMSSLVAALPAGIPTQMRYPWLRLHVNEKDRARIGFNNDYFVHGGNGNEYYQPSNKYYAGVLDVAHDVAVDGEMPWDKGQSKDPYAWSTPVPGDLAAQRLQSMHYSTFSMSHNATVTYPRWKSDTISPARLDELHLPYAPEEFRTAGDTARSRTVHEYLRDHLGYRLEARTSSVTRTGRSSLKVDSTLVNRGFAPARKPYPVSVVLLDDAGAIRTSGRVDADPRTWKGLEAGERTEATAPLPEHTASGTVDLSALRHGTYRVGLVVGDAAATRGSIQFANADVLFVAGANVIGTYRHC